MLRNGRRVVHGLEMVESTIRICTALGGAGYAAYLAANWWATEGGTWSILTLDDHGKRASVLAYVDHLKCKYREYTIYGDGTVFPVGKEFVGVPGEAGISIRGTLKGEQKCCELQVRGKNPKHIAGFVDRAVEFKKRTNDTLDRAKFGMYVYDVDDGYFRCELAPASFDTLFLPCCEAVVREVSRFVENRETYERVGTKWQKMIMFHGEPGCGKTSLIAAIARRFERSPMFIPLHEVKTLLDLTSRIEVSEYDIPFERSMIVLEEADTWAPICQRRNLLTTTTTYSDQDNTDSDSAGSATAFSAPSASCGDPAYVREKEKEARDNQLGILLNMFDGVRSYPGLLVVMTTNRLDMFDPALIRPGRTTCIEVGRLRTEHVNRTFRTYFGCDLPPDVLPDHEMNVTLAELAWLRDYIGDRDGALKEFKRRFHSSFHSSFGARAE
jgi:hypothetical protein